MAEDDTLSWDDILAGRLAGQGEKAANPPAITRANIAAITCPLNILTSNESGLAFHVRPNR